MILQENQAEEIVSRLRDQLHPNAIYIFGSQATGRASAAGSDVDLCVVVPDDDEDTYRKTVRAYKTLRDFGFSKDVIVRHESRFKERTAWLNSVEAEVARTGKLIYRREGGN